MTGDDTRVAIREVAQREFAIKGYESVSLEQIAEELGIPASTVLRYFATTADLLHDIVTPFAEEVDRLVARFARGGHPLSPADRVTLLTELVDTYCDHRPVLLMLLRDVARNWPVHINPTQTQRHERLVAVLAGDHPTIEQQVIIDAVLGVITRPMLDPAVDTDDVRTRRLLIALAIDTAKRLGNEASRSWSDGHRAADLHGLLSP